MIRKIFCLLTISFFLGQFFSICPKDAFSASVQTTTSPQENQTGFPSDTENTRSDIAQDQTKAMNEREGLIETGEEPLDSRRVSYDVYYMGGNTTDHDQLFENMSQALESNYDLTGFAKENVTFTDLSDEWWGTQRTYIQLPFGAEQISDAFSQNHDEDRLFFTIHQRVVPDSDTGVYDPLNPLGPRNAFGGGPVTASVENLSHNEAYYGTRIYGGLDQDNKVDFYGEESTHVNFKQDFNAKDFNASRQGGPTSLDYHYSKSPNPYAGRVYYNIFYQGDKVADRQALLGGILDSVVSQNWEGVDSDLWLSFKDYADGSFRHYENPTVTNGNRFQIHLRIYDEADQIIGSSTVYGTYDNTEGYDLIGIVQRKDGSFDLTNAYRPIIPNTRPESESNNTNASSSSRNEALDNSNLTSNNDRLDQERISSKTNFSESNNKIFSNVTSNILSGLNKISIQTTLSIGPVQNPQSLGGFIKLLAAVITGNDRYLYLYSSQGSPEPKIPSRQKAHTETFYTVVEVVIKATGLDFGFVNIILESFKDTQDKVYQKYLLALRPYYEQLAGFLVPLTEDLGIEFPQPLFEMNPEEVTADEVLWWDLLDQLVIQIERQSRDKNLTPELQLRLLDFLDEQSRLYNEIVRPAEKIYLEESSQSVLVYLIKLIQEIKSKEVVIIEQDEKENKTQILIKLSQDDNSN